MPAAWIGLVVGVLMGSEGFGAASWEVRNHSEPRAGGSEPFGIGRGL